MALSVLQLRKKVAGAINKMPEIAHVYRKRLDAFGDTVGEDFVCDIVGQYYVGGAQRGSGGFSSISVESGGITQKNRIEKFITTIDDGSELIRSGDVLYYNLVKFCVADLGRTLDVYFDFSLERI